MLKWRFVCGAWGVVALLTPSRAFAVDDEACRNAYEASQPLFKSPAPKLIQAREQLRICAKDECATSKTRRALVVECERWLDDVQSRIPTVVIIAKDATASDVTNVTVLMDGKAFATRLDGIAIDVDPGEHLFEVTFPDGATLSQKATLREGQKAQLVTLAEPLPSAAPVASSANVAEGPPPVPILANPTVPRDESESAGKASPLRTAGYILGGVGVAGLAAGAVFGGVAISQNNLAKCSNNVCDDANERRSAQKSADMSTIGFISGGILTAAGAVFILVSHRPAASKSASVRSSRWRVAPRFGISGPALSLDGAW